MNIQERRVEWLVELFHEGKSEGFWTGCAKGEGGWRTENAWAAKQYSENEAKAVAAALDYFPSPFRWSHWVATEHIFMGVDTYIRRTGEGEIKHSTPLPASAEAIAAEVPYGERSRRNLEAQAYGAASGVTSAPTSAVCDPQESSASELPEEKGAPMAPMPSAPASVDARRETLEEAADLAHRVSEGWRVRIASGMYQGEMLRAADLRRDEARDIERAIRALAAKEPR